MISNLRMVDTVQTTNFQWINRTDNISQLLKNGLSFEKGVNILVGKNGSGKTTIINLLRFFTLTDDWFSPKLDSTIVGDRFKETKIPVESFDIKANWKIPTFNLYRMKKDWRAMTSSDVLFSPESINTRLKCVEESDGQNQVADFNMLMREAYEKGPADNPFNLIEKYDKDSKLLEFYKANQIDDKHHTMLLDEPDANLDIDNVLDIYDFLQYMARNRHDTQVIATIHNPSIIYKLNKIEEINMIELSENYVEKIIKFIEE